MSQPVRPRRKTQIASAGRRVFRPRLPVLVAAWMFPYLLAAGVWAQSAPLPFKIGDITVQGSFRSRLEAWDWFEGAGENSYLFSGNVFRLSFEQRRKTIDWQVELAVPFLLGLPGNAVAPAPQGALGLGGNYFIANDGSRNAAMVFPKQAFIRFKNLFGEPANTLRLGRFEFIDGGETAPPNPILAALKRDRIAQRLIGPFGFTHVGRSFDGFHLARSQPKLNLTLVGALPTRGVFQVDGWGNLNVGFLYASATGQVTGQAHNGEWRLFGIYYQDWRDVLKTDNRPALPRAQDLADIRIGTFGGHYLHTVATVAGPIDLLFWGLGQTGRWGRLDHRANALAIEGGWQPKVLSRWKPWLRAGFMQGSGDSNPLDGRHGTFFQLLPTPRPYARFPFFNMMNNQDFFAMLILRPHASLTIRPEVHGLRLANRNDLWYQGGGAFQPWTFGYIGRPSNGNRGLATLYDISADYQVNRRTALTAYFSRAIGHSVVAAIYPRGKNANFGYLELNYRF